MLFLNREVAEDCALYWSRDNGALAKLIDQADELSAERLRNWGRWLKSEYHRNIHGIKSVGNMKRYL